MDNNTDTIMSTLTTYQISNRVSGHDFGWYTADSPEEALDTLAREAGYTDHAEARQVTGSDLDDLVAVEIKAEEIVLARAIAEGDLLTEALTS